MDGIQIGAVDERDSSWESDHPRFRVYFQRVQDSYIGGWTDTYDVTGADIVQVIDWAQCRAGRELVYSVALVYDDRGRQEANSGRGRGLVWLVGMDGNRVDLTPAEAEVQARMLARLREPLGVPPGDRMPRGIAEPSDDSDAGGD